MKTKTKITHKQIKHIEEVIRVLRLNAKAARVYANDRKLQWKYSQQASAIEKLLNESHSTPGGR